MKSIIYKESYKEKVVRALGVLPFYLFTLLPLSSCADLDQTSHSSIDIDNFYQSESDLQVALNGVYQVLSDREIAGEMHGIYNNEMIYFNDLQSEYARRGTANSADIAEIGNFAITPTNAFVESTWLVHYTGINRANNALETIDNVSNWSSEKTKNQLLCEIYFLPLIFALIALVSVRAVSAGIFVCISYVSIFLYAFLP